jgi:hypothetical protein
MKDEIRYCFKTNLPAYKIFLAKVDDGLHDVKAIIKETRGIVTEIRKYMIADKIHKNTEQSQ